MTTGTENSLGNSESAHECPLKVQRVQIHSHCGLWLRLEVEVGHLEGRKNSGVESGDPSTQEDVRRQTHGT